MNDPIQLTKTKSSTRNLFDWSPVRRAFLFILLALAWLALSPPARAVCQEGCDLIHSNTFLGNDALISNTTGSFNTANGNLALLSNTLGSANTASGSNALFSNTTGYSNTAMGNYALSANTTGFNNIALGDSAGSSNTTGSNNIYIGALGARSENNTMRLGRYGVQKSTFIAGVSGATVPGGVTVIIDSIGRVGTTTSSARYKEAIKPMDRASEAILSLQPVTFRYKKDLDPQGIPQFGLVAEQVEKVNPDLVARDDQGKPYTVRYEAVNAMLLNEFLKAHRQIDEQAQENCERGATISALKSALAQQQHAIESLTASLKAQAAQVQKVSDQLAASQAAHPMIVENR